MAFNNPTGLGVKRTKGVRLHNVHPRICQQCGSSFLKTPKETYAGWQARKFCGPACKKAARVGVAVTPNTQVALSCKQCGASFKVQQYRLRDGAKFCSHACFAADRNRGLTSVNDALRRSAAMRKWRLAVFERDDYTCQGCGVRGGELNADHIKPFAYFPELRFDVDNGRTLCVPCHRKTETYGIKAVRLMRLGAGLGF